LDWYWSVSVLNQTKPREKALPAAEEDKQGNRGDPGERRNGPFPGLLADLEACVASACDGDGEWPAQVAAGIYAGVDFAVANPTVVEAVTLDVVGQTASGRHYESIVQRLAKLISASAPADSRLPGTTDEALVAGIVGLVGDHVRIGRFDSLAQLRPDLVLLALLPYLGFDEARRWANESASSDYDD
jgi:hypothetical protein